MRHLDNQNFLMHLQMLDFSKKKNNKLNYLYFSNTQMSKFLMFLVK